MWLKACRWMVWLVAFGLPVQGMAAASMVHCTSHLATAQTAVGVHGHAAHGGHDTHASDAAHGAHASPEGSGSDATPSVCSACAACCAALALPGAQPEWPSIDTATDRLAVATPGVPPFLTGGPERPPRASRA